MTGHYDTLYLLLEDSKKLIGRFANDKGNCRLIAEDKLLGKLGLAHERTIRLESVFGEQFFEMEQQDHARRLLDTLMRIDDAARGESLTVGGVSIPEANSGSIILFYLQKACNYTRMASTLLDTFQAKRIIVSSLQGEFGKALRFECARRGVLFERISRGKDIAKRVREVFMKILWFGNEVLRGLLKPTGEKIGHEADVAFICNTVKFHETIGAIVKELIQKKVGKIAIITKCDIPGSLRITHPAVRYAHIHSFRDRRYVRRLIRESLRICRLWYMEKQGSVRKAVSENTYILDVLRQWFRRNALKTIRIILLAEAMFDCVKPRIVVVTDPTDFEVKALTLKGKTLEIPSLCIQYGIASDRDSEWRYFRQDYLGVFGRRSRAVMEDHGIESDRIFEVGNPRFDTYFKNDELRRSVRHKLGIPNGAVMAAFMSIPPSGGGVGEREGGLTLAEYQALLDAVYQVPETLSQVFLVAKPHPEEYQYLRMHERFRDQYAGRDRSVITFRDNSAHEIINASDVVITLQSTTGLEAIYLGKPLIVLNLTGRKELTDYVSSGAAYPARSKEELTAAIRVLVEQKAALSENYQEAQARYLCDSLSCPGKSASRCADVIINLSNDRGYVS